MFGPPLSHEMAAFQQSELQMEWTSALALHGKAMLSMVECACFIVSALQCLFLPYSLCVERPKPNKPGLGLDGVTPRNAPVFTPQKLQRT